MSADALPGVEMYEPGAQTVQGAHCAALVVVLKWPEAQPAQIRPVVVVPSLATNWPALQAPNRVQASAFWPALYEPGGQVPQVRSLAAAGAEA